MRIVSPLLVASVVTLPCHAQAQEAPAETDASAAAESEVPEGEAAADPVDQAGVAEEADAAAEEAEGEAATEQEAPAEGDEAGAEEAAEESYDEGPQRPPEPRWGGESRDKYAMDGKGMLITGITTMAVGGAGIGIAYWVTGCNHDNSINCKYESQRNFLVPMAITVTATGALLTAIGVTNMLRYKKWKEWTPEQAVIAPTFHRNGGGLAYQARF